MEKSIEKKEWVGLSIDNRKRHALSDLTKDYGRNPSMIATLLKQKETVETVKPSKGFSVISKKRYASNDEVKSNYSCG